MVTDPSNIQGDNAYHVVSSGNVTETAVLDGFTVTAGKADGDDPHDSGGGMYIADETNSGRQGCGSTGD